MDGVASIVLIIHLFVAVALIAVVLFQRSEGGALGIGGGAGSFMTARGAGNVLTRTTTLLAAGFFATSIILTLLARHGGTQELDLGDTPPPAAGTQAPAMGSQVPGTDGGAADGSAGSALPALPTLPGAPASGSAAPSTAEPVGETLPAPQTGGEGSEAAPEGTDSPPSDTAATLDAPSDEAPPTPTSP